MTELIPVFDEKGRTTLVLPSAHRFDCGHVGVLPFRVKVFDVECTFTDAPKCEQCAREYLNTYSTLCARCRRPIFPGNGICCDGDGKFPYTHAGLCGDAPGFCGHWGEGAAKRFDDPKHWPTLEPTTPFRATAWP